jgi:two-component system cell cycle response regulator DivK
MTTTPSGGQRALPVVLVVEDFEELYELYSDFLAGAGFAVEGCSSGEQAVDEALRLIPDLIIMDLGLPRMNGWDAIQIIKADPRTHHVPVLALTGHVQRRFADLARQAGADSVLFKPCPLHDLLGEIERLLRADADAKHP